MYYNKAVFKKAGVTQTPKTWPELIAVADKVKAAGVKPFYQTNILFSFVWFETLLAGKDPDLYDALATGKAKYTDPGVVEVMNEWKKMIDAGYFSDPGSKTEPQAQLKNGDVAMINFGTWFSGNLNTLKMKAGTDYDFFVIPNVNASLPKTSMIFETGPVCSAAQSDARLHGEEVDRLVGHARRRRPPGPTPAATCRSTRRPRSRTRAWPR